MTSRTTWTGKSAEWLPLPGQHLDLPDAQGRLLEASLTLRERDGQEHEWTAVADFVFSGREDRVFVIDRAAGALRFGDGRTGRIPVPDPASAGPGRSPRSPGPWAAAPPATAARPPTGAAPATRSPSRR